MSPSNRDEWYMEQALKQAARAAERDEVPVGAIIIDGNGSIIARAYNKTKQQANPLAHAEILAIQKAAHTLHDWRLNNCTLYVTVEPCALCMHVILISRIKRLVYGAASPVFGFSLDKYCTFDVYKTTLLIQSGVKKNEAQLYMKHFFKQKRSQSHGKNTHQVRTSRSKAATNGAKKRT